MLMTSLYLMQSKRLYAHIVATSRTHEHGRQGCGQSKAPDLSTTTSHAAMLPMHMYSVAIMQAMRSMH